METSQILFYLWKSEELVSHGKRAKAWQQTEWGSFRFWVGFHWYQYPLTELFSAAWMSAKQNTKQKLHFLSFTAIKTSTLGSNYQSILWIPEVISHITHGNLCNVGTKKTPTLKMRHGAMERGCPSVILSLDQTMSHGKPWAWTKQKKGNNYNSFQPCKVHLGNSLCL